MISSFEKKESDRDDPFAACQPMAPEYSSSLLKFHPGKNATFVLCKRRDENNHNTTTTNYSALQIEIRYEIKS